MNGFTKEYLNIIAERLWDGHASLFVGAGLSKNAICNDGGHLPPDWCELGDLFYKKSRKKKTVKAPDRAYANIMRLAEEVESMYGRSALIDLLKDAINDDRLIPADIHLRLLSLPWNDVYTTNYDTLLERASRSLNESNKRSYSLVTSDYNLGMTTPPFLVKLHGDISDPKSVIITEEDYRSYPKNHPALINRIQNTIMMETLVLIGFSGNDPNFIKWLGWVKEALNNNQRKVYLLSLDAVPEATQKTLERKNVVIVDIKDVAGKHASYSNNLAKALSFFEEFHLRREDYKQYRKSVLEWGSNFERDEDIEQTFNRWRKERETYPGWLVLPREKRESWLSYDGFNLSHFNLSKLTGNNDLLFLDLFNWRIEKCLLPIENNWENVYLSVLKRYQPFSKRCSSSVRSAWLNLKFALLRLYRQEGWHEKWKALNNELESIRNKFSEEHNFRFYYEQSLEAIYRNDFKLLEGILDNWGEAKSDLYWDVRRGSLWAEFLCFEKGKEITEKAFKGISKRFEESCNESDKFYWASRKVYAHSVLNTMSNANFCVADDEFLLARQTWTDLRSYEDIRYEEEFFKENMRPIEEAVRVKTKTDSFKLGEYRISTSLSGNSKYYRVAYAFFLYYEEVAHPVHLPFLNSIEKTTLEKALSVMEYCSPSIAECWMLRSGDSKMVPAVYNRRFLERTNFQKVELLYGKYLECLYGILQLSKEDEILSWVIVYQSILPEILSRLCMKVSYELRIKTLDYIEFIYHNNLSLRFNDLDHLLSSLVSTFSLSEIADLIPRFVGMSIAKDRYGGCRLDPTFYIREPVKIKEPVSKKVDNLIKLLGAGKKDDQVVLFRLLYLNKCKALSKKQQDKLAFILWSKVDSSGFPEGTFYLRYMFLSFPHPKDINPETIFEEYIKKQPLPIIGKGTSFYYFGGYAPILNDLLGTSNTDISFKWNASLLNSICTKLVYMWDSDKDKLRKEETSSLFPMKGELQIRFRQVKTIVTEIVLPRRKLLTLNNMSNLMRLAREFEEYGIPSLRLKVAFFNKNIEREVQHRLGLSDSFFIEDCVSTIIMLFKEGKDVMRLVELISEYFRSNNDMGMHSFIKGLSFFVTKKACMNYGLIRQNLLIGLERLFVDTKIIDVDDELQANQKMHFRMIVAPIVSALMNTPMDTQPNSLSLWQNYYENEETCLDIRSFYKNYSGN